MTSEANVWLRNAVGHIGTEALHSFRQAIEATFPGRLHRLVLFGSRARGDHEEGSDWDVAAFIDGFDRHHESRRLNLLVVPFHVEGFAISPIGLPADRQGVSPELLVSIDRDGISIGRTVCPKDETSPQEVSACPVTRSPRSA